MATAQNSQAQLRQNNLIARQMLLQTGISMIKRLAPVNASLGDQVKIPLLRMGIMTGVLLQFTVPIDVTVAATVSPVGPWNLVQGIKYTDFVGVDRTRTNGFQLWAAQSMKQSDALSQSPAMAQGPSGNYNTNIISQPTAVAAGNLQFSLYIPMAYDPASDLTGAVMTATNVGEHYVTVNLAQALVNADPWIAPYISGTVATTGSIVIEPYQFYIQPQDMSAQSLPVIDLSMIYGFEGNYQNTANINSNQDVFVDYPNNRSIFSALMTYENGSAFTVNETDVSQITLIANSNTNFREMSPRMLREMMRNMMNSDLPSGSYYLSSRRQPILTQLYANVQARFSILNRAGAGTVQIVSQFEVQYPSGVPLPGYTVAA